jgi:hypothetical protein
MPVLTELQFSIPLMAETALSRHDGQVPSTGSVGVILVHVRIDLCP